MLRITEKLRKILSNPIGRVYEGRGVELFKKIEEIKSARFLATIGDLVTLFSFQAGYTPDLAVIDFKTEREILEKEITSEILEYAERNSYEVIKVRNPQGHISEELVEGLKKGVERRTLIIVEGEEDMAALPLSLILPEKSIIVYGVPSRGVAVYEVNERDKVLISEMVEEMEEVGDDRVKKMLLEVR